MSVDQAAMKNRTKSFALRIIRLVRSLPRDMASQEVARQLLRSGCSVAANYRAACRSRSRAEFVARMGVVEEEADETLLWLELLADSELVPRTRLNALMTEADELLSIAVASIRTARGRSANPKSAIRNPQ